MQKYTDIILSPLGTPIGGAVITVTNYPSNTPATIYATDGGSAVDSVMSDPTGRFSFYAADGHYNLSISGTGITPQVVNDIVLNDPSNDATLAALAASGGSALVGFQQAGAGAVARKAQERLRETVSVLDFGANADWNGTTGTNNTAAFTAALAQVKANGGGTLLIPPGDYYFGAYSTSSNIVSVVGLNNVLVSGYGARLIANTAAESTPFLLYFDSPNDVTVAGLRFLDVGFDPSSWFTHSRWGMGAIRLDANTASKGFRMVDCQAENLTYLLVGDFRANKRKFKNITVQNCRVKNAYYGVDLIYAGDNLMIDNLICEDVRRGFISFGARNADVDIKLYTNSGFYGSNAFISLGCEGQAYDDGYGVLGADGDVDNVRIKLNVSGYEAHINYVHFYHQQNDSAGTISNVQADVMVNNLSAAGKNASIGNTNIFKFDHELPSTSILGNTTRTFKQISLSGGVVGSITGEIVSADSVNLSDPATVSLSPNLAKLVQSYTASNFNGAGTSFLTPYERPLTGLTPVGATTAGAVTGLTCSGTWCHIGKRVFFNAKLAWTGHTGTGPLRLNGLPKPTDTAFPTPTVDIMGDGLSHTSGAKLCALLGGSGNTQVMIYEESAGALATVAVDSSVTGLYISGSYVTP